MKRAYEAWGAEGQVALLLKGQAEEYKRKGLLSHDAELLYTIDADTMEEASAIHNLRMGFGPYDPMGDPANCPKCGAWFYPKGSGECWRCGKIC
jgi:hypothetical protein